MCVDALSSRKVHTLVDKSMVFKMENCIYLFTFCVNGQIIQDQLEVDYIIEIPSNPEYGVYQFWNLSGVQSLIFLIEVREINQLLVVSNHIFCLEFASVLESLVSFFLGILLEFEEHRLKPLCYYLGDDDHLSSLNWIYWNNMSLSSPRTDRKWQGKPVHQYS